MKLVKRLIVGEVKIYSLGNSELVAQATCTYSIPPKSIMNFKQNVVGS